MTDINTRGYPNPEDPNDPTHGKGMGPQDPYTGRTTDLFPAKCYSNHLKKNDSQNPQQERHYWQMDGLERYNPECLNHARDYMEKQKVGSTLMLKKNVEKFKSLSSTGGRRRRRKSRKSKTFRKKQKKRKTRRKSRKSKKRKSKKSKKRRTRRRRK